MTEEKNYPESLSQTLNLLADKLGVKADQLFKTVCKQAEVEFYMNIIYLIGYVVLFIVGCIGLSHIYPLWMDKTDFPSGKLLILFLETTGSVISLLISIFSFIPTIHEMITLKANPHYWALNDILSYVNSDK